MKEKIKRIQLPTHEDERGKLTVLELKDFIDWDVKRIYYVTDTKLDRGGHAVRGEKKIYVCMQGSMKARINDGKEWHEFELKGPGEALLMNEMCWREFTDFSDGSVLMAVSSVTYEPEKYIFDLEEFLGEGAEANRKRTNQVSEHKKFFREKKLTKDPKKMEKLDFTEFDDFIDSL